MKRSRRIVLPARRGILTAALVLLTGLARPALPVHAAGDPDLASLPLEDLLQLEVTSVSKHSQPLAQAPAAVSVLTGEDIRRSGMTTIADVLRLVPGLHVANGDANKWAVTARGFNSQFANKLLVLIDGRSVYTPLFSGVFWDVQDVVLEDIDRIEVVRGPGGTVWGANAVNGVINIITRQAADTEGLLLSSSGGSLERAVTGRFGGALGNEAHYRVSLKYFNREEFDAAFGVPANDDWDAVRGGLRLDWDPTEDDRLTFQGDYYDGTSGQTVLNGLADEQDVSGGNFLARWSHAFSDTSELQLQSYYDRTERKQFVVREDRDAFDIEVQHRFRPLPRNDLTWGAGYRLMHDEIGGSGVSFVPDSHTDHLWSAFLEDEILLVEGLLSLTLGSKFEHNDYSGFEFQPSASLVLTPHERHTVWAAVSRAVRSPSRAEFGVAFVAPDDDDPLGFRAYSGNRGFDSEDLLAYELGYRTRPIDRVSLDVAGYYNVYDDLRSAELQASIPSACPPTPTLDPGPCTLHLFRFDNRVDAVGYGVELTATWQVTDFWRLAASYTLMRLEIDPDPNSADPLAEDQEGNHPDNQVILQSRLDLPWDFEFDTSFWWVDKLTAQDIAGHTRLDLRLGWRPLEHLELSLVGQNLTERRHIEFNDNLFSFPTAVPRSAYGKVTWRY